MNLPRKRGRPVLIGTQNRGKIEEIYPVVSSLLPGFIFRLLDQLPGVGALLPPQEEGTSYLENALQKARAYSLKTALPVLCEDSGLEVEALGGAPGIYSHRYAGKSATDRENYLKLLKEMAGVPPEKRKAKFVAVAVLYFREDLWFTGKGILEGRISLAPRGEGGFGYDPIFIPRGLDRTVSELTLEEKISLSHRTSALKELAKAVSDSSSYNDNLPL
jgi:XTP/dITP diphosphohydrolase